MLRMYPYQEEKILYKNKCYEIFFDVLKNFPEQKISCVIVENYLYDMLFEIPDTRKYIFSDEGIKIFFKCSQSIVYKICCLICIACMKIAIGIS